jgi:oligopeptide/dipeptide ABC transporter ATP-binding protein
LANTRHAPEVPSRCRRRDKKGSEDAHPIGIRIEGQQPPIVFTAPLHPYTESLLLAVPVPDPAVKRQKRVLQGDVPSPINPPAGCHSHTRCPYAFERCRQETPILREVKPGQMVACHLR